MSVKTTPPQDESSSQMLQLESAILRKTRGQAYYTKLQDWLISQQTDDATPQKCSVEMMKKIITVLQGELQCQQFQQARVIVLAIQHVTKFRSLPSGLPILLSSGLVEILVYAFQVTETSISKNDSSSSLEKEYRADLLMQTILETANDIADYSPDAKQLTVKRFTDKLMDLIIDHRKVFQLCTEAQRTLNLLLENCPGHLTQSLVESDVIKKLMQKIAESLPSLGDFEMQVACTEALARLVTKSKRPEYAAQWFPEEKFASAFLAIQDLNFETDCRKFLNIINETCGGKRSVHSFPCQAAFLGGFRLLQPPDENLSDFWVDFNSGSKSVTMYVADNSTDQCEDDGEGSMWETVTIKGSMVKSYSLTKQSNSQKLQLELRTPACEILHFCPSQHKSATISFGSSIDLSDALACSLGEEKCMPSQETQKKASVSKVNVRVNRAEFTSTGTINGHAINGNAMRNGTHHPVAAQRNQNPVVSTLTRPKVSVPIVPMRTPTLTSYRSSPSVASTQSSNGYTSSGSRRNSNNNQPKTPTGQSSSGAKKVKTPLQIVVADKHPAPSTSNESDAQNIPRSAKKVSSTIAAIPINRRQDWNIDENVIQSTVVNSSVDNAKEKGSNSVVTPIEEPKPSMGDRKKAPGSSKTQELASNISKDHQEINTKADDKSKVPEPDDESDSQTRGRNTKGGKHKKKTSSSSQKCQDGMADEENVVPELDDESDGQTTGRRTRGSKCKKKPALSSQECQEGNGKQSGRQTRSSKKFKLYSADNTMLLPDSQNSQETGKQRSKCGKKRQEEEKEEQKEVTSPGKTDETKLEEKTQKWRDGQQKKTTPDSSQDLEEDLVIPSSIPGTQDSSDGDVITPPSFYPIPNHLIAAAKRRIEQAASTNTSICQSPSLSTITEESTQSQKSTSTMSTGINEDHTVTQRDKDHASNHLPKNKTTGSQEVIDTANKEFNMKKNANTKARSKKSPPKVDTAAKSQQSLIPQLDHKEPNGKKETGRCTNKSLTKQKPMGNEPNYRDPYLFTDTESAKSLDISSTQNTAKQQKDKKGSNKQASERLSDGGKVPASKAKGSQISTHSFSPELSQESPYLSQNDFRSPVELSGVKFKQGKGKKTKTGGKGKENGQSNNRQDDDSLSDVEIMRDANASLSSVKDNYATGQPTDDDAYRGDEIYKLSGNIAAKLLQNKAELEKILKSSDKKLKQKKAILGEFSEASTEIEGATNQEEGKHPRSSANSTKTSSGSEETLGSKSCTGGNNNTLQKSKKQSKSTNAFNSFVKPKFDPALLKFPTRVGPIPTPGALEEESKRMKKKSKQSTTKPFSSDGSDEEEGNIGTEEFQPTEQNSERNPFRLIQGKDQLDSDQVEDNLTGHSDNEGINEDVVQGKTRTRKQQGERSGKSKMDVQESSKSKKASSTGRTKQKQKRDEETDSQSSIKEQEEMVAGRRKPRKAAMKASRDHYVEEASDDEEVHQSDDQVANRKKVKSATKHKKQKRKKTRSSDFAEEYKNDEMQGNHLSKNKKQSIKTQEKKAKKENARENLKDYSSEEFDIQDVHDDTQNDEEIQIRQQRKTTEHQSTKSARSRQQTKVSSNKKQKKDHKSSRKFSSQIEDAECDENEEQNADEDQDEEDDRETVTSVESFHSLCKNLLENSGDGIGATRSRRHIPRVNYKDPENSEIDFSESGSSEGSVANTSHRNVSKLSKDGNELASPASSKPSTSKSDDSQTIITNRSWLVDKPKQRVSTYSKMRAEQWIGKGPPVNLDTESAKKRPKPHTRPAEAAKKKATVVHPKKQPFEQSEEQHVSQQKAKKSDRHSNNKKAKKTVSNKRKKNQQEENEEEEFYDLERKAPPALSKKWKQPQAQSDEEDDVYQYYYGDEDMSLSDTSDQLSNNKKAKKTDSSSRQTKQQQKNMEKAPPALPKKPRRPQAQSDEEEEVYQYYYREKYMSSREKSDQSSSKKKADSSKRQKQQQQEAKEFDDLEMMRSQHPRHNATPISSAILDYNTPRCDVDVYPMTLASMMQDDDNEEFEIQLSQISLAITPRRVMTPSSRPPKMVTFEEDKVTSEQNANDDRLIVLGPAKDPRPTKSALKRKYPDRSQESEDETSMTSDKDRDRQQEVEQSQGQGMLKPKKLFKTSFADAVQTKTRCFSLEDDSNAVVADKAETNDGMSSLPSFDPDSAMLQMAQMMKVVGENIKEKMRRKESKAQKITERTIKTAEKQVTKLWSGRLKARKNTQEEFQEKLLTEIVGLESDLNEMEHSLNKSQALLQQHQRKVSSTLMNHVKKVHKLENDYRNKGEALEVELGQHLVRNVKGLLKQGLIDLQKKMVQDEQQHEIQSMKRSLQSFLL